MPSNAVLAELELLPLWQLRAARCIPAHQGFGPLTAMPVSTRQGAEGWALLSRPLDGDEETLFTNLLFAMKLRYGDNIAVDPEKLLEEGGRGRISWLWLIGEATASLLDTTSSAVVPAWKDLAVFVSAHPAEMLSQPELKSKFWVDWCRFCA
ncbi:MAG: hypothetical protein ACYC3O_01420 [Burkholderiales bacterium]